MDALTNLSEDERLFQESIRDFANQSLRPRVPDMDAKAALEPECVKEFFEMGLMGIELPQDLGGSQGSFFMSCLAIEEIARVDPAAAVAIDVQNTLVNNIFLRWANDAQQKQYMPRLAADTVGAFCLTEAGSGSDAFALECKAVREGDDWVLTGKKVFITNAAEAGIFVVFATMDASAGYKGITAFIVEDNNPGLSLGKKEDKLGIRASSTCEVILEGAKVSSAAVLGEVGKGYKIAIETLNEGRIGIAAQMLGLAQGAFDGAQQYASERSQFGQTIDGFQGIQFDLAEQATLIEASRLMVYNAARLKDAGVPFLKQAAMAKYFVSDVAERVASRALEIYGGYGFIKEFPAEKFYRDAKIGKIYEGTSNLQLQTIFKLLQSERS